MKSIDKYLKIKGLMEVKEYGLPMSETIFIFDFKKQEKEIDEFLKNRKYVAIRSDKKTNVYFCPHNLKCPRKKAKKFIKELIRDGYAVIMHEQNYDPLVNRNQLSGNILILDNAFLIELMEGEPLILLNRDGKVDEFLKIQKSDFKILEHYGEKLIKKKDLTTILNKIKNVPSHKIIEFTLRPEGFICWQIRDDNTAKMLERNMR